MASTQTLAELRAAVYFDGDIRSVRVAAAKVDIWINQGIKELWNHLVQANQDFALSSTDISVVAGTVEYALPANYLKAVAVDKDKGGGRWVAVKRFNFADRNQRLEIKYRIMGANLRVSGPENWSGTLRLWYIPTPTKLVADGDIFDGINGHEEYVINFAIIKAKQKDDVDLSVQLALKKDLEQKIAADESDRDLGEPDQVRDIRGSFDDSYYGV
jgi:hypothetical protein